MPLITLCIKPFLCYFSKYFTLASLRSFNLRLHVIFFVTPKISSPSPTVVFTSPCGLAFSPRQPAGYTINLTTSMNSPFFLNFHVRCYIFCTHHLNLALLIYFQLLSLTRTTKLSHLSANSATGSSHTAAHLETTSSDLNHSFYFLLWVLLTTKPLLWIRPYSCLIRCSFGYNVYSCLSQSIHSKKTAHITSHPTHVQLCLQKLFILANAFEIMRKTPYFGYKASLFAV